MLHSRLREINRWHTLLSFTHTHTSLLTIDTQHRYKLAITAFFFRVLYFVAACSIFFYSVCLPSYRHEFFMLSSGFISVFFYGFFSSISFSGFKFLLLCALLFI